MQASENLVSTRCGKSMLFVFKVILANMEFFVLLSKLIRYTGVLLSY